MSENIIEECKASVHHNENFGILLGEFLKRIEDNIIKHNSCRDYIHYRALLRIIEDVFNVHLNLLKSPRTFLSRYSGEEFKLLPSGVLGLGFKTNSAKISYRNEYIDNDSHQN